LHHDLGANELDPRLHQNLILPRDDLRLPEGHVEEEEGGRYRDEHQDHDVVQAEFDPKDLHRPEDVVEDEVPGRRRLEGLCEDHPEESDHCVTSSWSAAGSTSCCPMPPATSFI